MQYRIYLENVSPFAVDEVRIYDQTPPYTALLEPIDTSTAVTPDLTCTLSKPAANAASYRGPLEWNCTGTLLPSEVGNVSFRVAISP